MPTEVSGGMIDRMTCKAFAKTPFNGLRILFDAMLWTILLVLSSSVDVVFSAPQPLEDGFEAIFNGENLDGWSGDMEWFRVEEGAIAAGSLERPIPHNFFLTYEKEYSDFELRLEVKLEGDPASANAGIQVRSRRVPDHHEMVGYQADMGQSYWGALYDESRRNRILARPAQEELEQVLDRDGWNDYVIRCRGPRIQLWLNGLQTVDYYEGEEEIPREGRIGLQVHGGPPSVAYYRNIRIRILGQERTAFRRHELNREAKFEAASFVDLDGDGDLDIFSGGYWYEAPSWRRHFVREIAETDEYYHDFSNLPLDLDRDGRPDIITVAWHSEAVSWLRNEGDGAFTLHEIGRPGNMETALLVDLNGDGSPDLLPALNFSPAWYEASPGAEGMVFTYRELSEHLKGHGIGAGDVDGDGRVDLVGSRGWLERKPGDGWFWHGEFDLGATSVPILVHDVDGDGDADLIWGRGHDYGLYWMEQAPNESGARSWRMHAIDESWSQAHFLILADLDLDGDEDLIAGKRFRAHNGKDPGSSDPMAIYWYDFDPLQKEWIRHPVDDSGRVGLGLSGDVADFDEDGDMDILAPGKDGLYLLENLLRD